jgi:hypothetical protein
MTQEQNKKWHLYLLASLPLIIGIVVCVFLSLKAWRNISVFENSLARVVVPGEKILNLTAPGDYTIFHEYRTVVDGIVYSSPEYIISGLSCTLENAHTGEVIPLKPSTSNMTYSFGSREGRAVFNFSVAEAGKLRFGCLFPGAESKETKTVLAIGQGFGEEIFNMIFLIFGIVSIFIVSFSITTGVIVYLIVKKK